MQRNYPNIIQSFLNIQRVSKIARKQATTFKAEQKSDLKLKHFANLQFKIALKKSNFKVKLYIFVHREDDGWYNITCCHGMETVLRIYHKYHYHYDHHHNHEYDQHEITIIITVITTMIKIIVLHAHNHQSLVSHQ